MTSQQNPYSSLINMIKKHGAAYNPPPIQLGVVLNSSPLTVKVGDLQLYSNNLFAADYLLSDYQREAELNNMECEGYAHISERIREGCSLNNGSFKSTSKMKFKDGLKSGDTLAVLPTYDHQKYIILARVVRL